MKNTNIINTVNTKCNYCFKEFSRNSSLKRHLEDRCKKKKEIEYKKEKIFKNLLSDMKDMKIKIDKLTNENNNLKQIVTNNVTHTTNNTVNSNNIINNTFNIQLVAFGEEDRSCLQNSEIFNMLKKGFNSANKTCF